MLDAAGDVFIADTANNVVRKVDAATGLITTVAGNGAAGYRGDGGLATAAELAAPTGIALDAWGNLFIADFGNHVVREVQAGSGVIHTFAGNGQCDVTGLNNGDGGPATAAKLAYPSGIALDSLGDLFIVDPWTGTVREVNASTGIISRVAGVAGAGGGGGYYGDGGPATGAALYWPTGIAVDSSGDLFIADSGNNAVREVSGSTGAITTVAGGVSGPGIFAEGVAVDGSGDLFIADGGNDVVEEITGVNGLAPQMTIVAGDGDWSYGGDGGPATAAALNGPCGLAVAGAMYPWSAGNLFIADSGNAVIRSVALSSGTMETIAGNGPACGYSGDGGAAATARLNNPNAIAVDASGDLFIADTNNNVVREVNAETGVISTVAGNGTCGYSGDGGQATSAELDCPCGVAVDSTAGLLYIADTGNNVVRVVDLASGVITTFAGGGSEGLGDEGPATAAELNGPMGLAVDSAGDLYIADTNDDRIREVAAGDDAIDTVAGDGGGYSGNGGQATAAELSYPMGVAVDSAGNIYIADTCNNVVRKVNSSA